MVECGGKLLGGGSKAFETEAGDLKYQYHDIRRENLHLICMEQGVAESYHQLVLLMYHTGEGPNMVWAQHSLQSFP